MSNIEKINKLIKEYKKWKKIGDEHFIYYKQQNLDKALVEAKTVEETKLLLDAGANPNKRVFETNEAFTHAKSIEQMQALVDAGAEITDRDFVDCLWHDHSNIWREKCHFLLSQRADKDQPIPTWNSMFNYVNNPINVNPGVWYSSDLEKRWKRLETVDGRREDKLERAKIRVKSHIEQNKAMTGDIKEGIAKTQESGYKHISRTPSLNKGGREE